MSKYNKSIGEKGFTLVELLVVVAIIAVLAGVVIVAINPAALLQKSRDATRLQDVENIHKAMSLALADGEITLTATPANCGTCDSLGGTQAVDGTGWVQFAIPTGKTGLAKYLPTLPADALNTGANVYTFGSTVAGYELNTVLESPDNAAKMSTDGGNAAGIWEVGTSLTIL
ncbi:prepilin-type N-terminal cleavage/methylation domain-containing protein [candidate division WWE3 bacterium]|nr:prepilin-type N-terminal cleavage/methylation domain-containing protein [candidate division WWE3 bacterium]